MYDTLGLIFSGNITPVAQLVESVPCHDRHSPRAFSAFYDSRLDQMFVNLMHGVAWR